MSLVLRRAKSNVSSDIIMKSNRVIFALRKKGIVAPEISAMAAVMLTGAFSAT